MFYFAKRVKIKKRPLPISDLFLFQILGEDQTKKVFGGRFESVLIQVLGKNLKNDHLPVLNLTLHRGSDPLHF